MTTHGRFRGKHHSIGPIQHRIGHIENLCTGWLRVGNHRLHHLGSRNNNLIAHPGLCDNLLLDPGKFRVTQRDPKVASSDHNDVRRLNDRINILDGLETLDLRDDVRMAARTAHQLSSKFNVLCAAYK